MLEDFLLSGPITDAPCALVSPKTKISEEMDFYKDGLERFLRLFKKSDEIQERILATALKANGESASYFPQILDYAVQRFGKDDKRLTRLISAVQLAGNVTVMGVTVLDAPDDLIVDIRKKENEKNYSCFNRGSVRIDICPGKNWVIWNI